MESINAKPKGLFKGTIFFLERIGFEIFDNKDFDDFFKRFKLEVENRFSEKIEELNEVYLRLLIFRYLGFTTSYGFGYEFTQPICRQIWNFIPSIEDHYEDQFGFINSHLNRLVGKPLPVSDIKYELEGNSHFVNFKYRDETAFLQSDHLTILSLEYIVQVAKFTKGDPDIDNLYILEYFHSDEPVLFTIPKKRLKALLEHLEIDEIRII